jgi:hypothetical protein
MGGRASLDPVQPRADASCWSGGVEAGRASLVGAVLAAAGTTAALFAWEGHAGFSLWDEGYLWYGAQRVLAGEVPVRDFGAYDPGRYYWSAGLMALWGDAGIMALRASIAVCQALGLFIGITLLIRSSPRRDVFLWLLALITFAVWMFPRHKLFDISVSLALVGALVALVRQPTARRYFLAGICVGVAAVFGRNHGVYGAVGSLGLMGYLAVRSREWMYRTGGPAAWATGVVTGYLPLLVMLAVVPGFAQAFWEHQVLLVVEGGAALPIPVPWPWHVAVGTLTPVDIVRKVLFGSWFVGLLAACVAGPVWVIRETLRGRTVSPLLVACAFLTLPYAHHAFSRSDISHLAQATFPLLLGLFAVLVDLPGRVRWPAAAAVAATSVFLMLPQHPGWQCRKGACVAVEVSGDQLTVKPGTARHVALLRSLADEHAPNGRPVLVEPVWPGAYALLNRRSPVYDIFALRSRRPAFQQAEVRRISDARPGLIVVLDRNLDGNDDFRFRNNRPLIYAYIRDNFAKLDTATHDPSYELYVPRR